MLRVNDVFESISGEAGGFPQGTWTTFIRLQGCNLLCLWNRSPCDTPQAQDKNGLSYEMDIDSILKMVRNKHVLITGGEPLLQEETPELIKTLLKCGHVVQVETNGSVKLPLIANVLWVVDRKCPSSGMSGMMLPIEDLSEQIEQAQVDYGSCSYLKWVVSDDEDVDFAVKEMKELIHLGNVLPFIISPVNADGSKINGIVEKIKEKEYSLLDQIIFSVQLHKIFKMP